MAAGYRCNNDCKLSLVKVAMQKRDLDMIKFSTDDAVVIAFVLRMI